ncbi:MAG: acyl-ACP--UDP-N-acetylglucosamine O-acyltransferase [Hyphomicrobiaceae bacterium]
MIHPTAIVDKAAKVGTGVSIGPYTVIGPEVELGDGVRLHAHVVVDGVTRIGPKTEIFPFASIGHRPQDLKFKGERSSLEIGARNIIREHVTMNPGTEGGGLLTKLGDDCLVMVGAHVAHDCQIGNHVILVNNATLGGHCIIEDYAIIGGLAAIHQFVRIGAFGFVGGMSGVEADVIPFGMVLGNRAALSGLNITGLKRAGFNREQIHTLRQAYRLLFSNEGTLAERLADLESQDAFASDQNVRRIIDFIKAKSDRSLCVPR